MFVEELSGSEFESSCSQVPYYLVQGRSAFNKNTKTVSSSLLQANVFFHFSDHKNRMAEKTACSLICRPVLVIGNRRKQSLK